MCEKCLYRNNCQFLAKKEKIIVADCTAFMGEAELISEIASKIFNDIEKCLDGTNILYTSDIIKLKKKYIGE